MGSPRQQLAERRPEGFAVAQFWIDTRDTRNVSRATKFCHRFVIRLDRSGTRGRMEAEVAQRPIAQLSRMRRSVARAIFRSESR